MIKMTIKQYLWIRRHFNVHSEESLGNPKLIFTGKTSSDVNNPMHRLNTLLKKFNVYTKLNASDTTWKDVSLRAEFPDDTYVSVFISHPRASDTRRLLGFSKFSETTKILKTRMADDEIIMHPGWNIEYVVCVNVDGMYLPLQ